MSNSNVPSEFDLDETLRELTEGEISAIAGATIVQANGGKHS